MRGFRQWRWHLDEMYVKLNGEMVYLRRTVDQEGELHVNLIKVPAPLPEAAHLARSLASDVACEQRPEPVPPHPYRLVAQIDPALEQQVFDIAKAERVFHLHHHHEADHLGRGVKPQKRAWRLGSGFAWHAAPLAVAPLV